MIVLYLIILIAGMYALVKGADLFVDGSVGIARYFKVPGLIVGLTIVALGTSAPELAVSTLAACQGSNEIALSNVVGSNIFNLLAVLGLCAVIFPLPVEEAVLKRDFPFSIIVTGLLLTAVCGTPLLTGMFSSHDLKREVGIITHVIGGILVLAFIGYISFLIRTADRRTSDDPEEADNPVRKCVMLLIAGLVLIIAGGQAVVYSAKEIARAAGMTETLIGLTIVAVGTSLPELVTSVVAARKEETELAIGNIIGSNIFNLLFILGVSAVIHPIAVNLASVYDMLILIFVSMLTYFFALSLKRIARVEGVIMIIVYIADMVFAVIR